MAVLVADLIEPKGPVQPDMFPQDTRGDEVTPGTLEFRIRGYLDDAEAKVAAFVAAHPDDMIEGFDGDAAVKAWASYRAFAARFITLSSNPANATLTDQGGRSYIQAQIEAFENRAKDFRTEHQQALSLGLKPKAGQTRDHTGTQSVRITFGL